GDKLWPAVASRPRFALVRAIGICAHRFRSCALVSMSPAHSDEASEEREVVRALGRDHGRVLAEAQVPDDLPVLSPEGVGPLTRRGDEDEVADHDRRAEDLAADIRAPALHAR